MPQTGIGSSYYDIGGSLREDVRDLIAQITPVDTPFFDLIGEGEAKQRLHEWLARELSTRQRNSFPEGAGFSFVTTWARPTRNFNICQILKREISVTRSSAASWRYAIADLMGDELDQRNLEWKTDAEHAMIRGSFSTGNTQGTRDMNGLFWVFATQSSNKGPASGTHGTAAFSGSTFSENDLNSFYQRQWELGVRPRDLLVNGNLKRRISQFQGILAPSGTGNRVVRDQNDMTIVQVVSVYMSDFGTVEIQLSRDVPQGANATALLLFDRKYFKKAWLDYPFVERTAKVADSIDAVIIGELTLEYGHVSAGGIVFGTN